jgi:cytoskeleton protein RodZ
VNKPVKLPEIRKEAFTKARESLGLSTKDLAGMACLSVRQIEQIENGESSSFYGAQVKVTAAKKVAGLLKMTPEEAFDFSGVVQPVKPVDAQEKLQEKDQTSAVDKSAKSKKAKETKKQVDQQEDNFSEEKEVAPVAAANASAQEKSAPRKIEPSALDYSVKSKANPKKKLILILAIAAAVTFSVINLRPLFFPEPVKEEVVIIQEVAPEPAPPPTSPPVESAPAAPAPVSAPAPAVTASTDCPVPDSTTLTYKPDAPKKSGDMVYLQSKTVQTVCISDATGKIQNKTLEPGVGVSVYGKPPFKVLTGGLNQVDIYYQGAKVRIANPSAKTINLESAEVVAQPAAPLSSTDSQLR